MSDSWLVIALAYGTSSLLLLGMALVAYAAYRRQVSAKDKP